jgi:predicted nucleic acid-binding protein
MVVVSDTSPLSNLAIIGRLDLVRGQFGLVLVPSAVRRELMRLEHGAASDLLDAAFNDGWLQVTPLLQAVPGNLSAGLHAGEAEALALALEHRADFTLLDDGDARRRAMDAGLRITGALGILLRAKREGEIPSFRNEIRRLRNEAHFFIAPRLERELIAAAGEIPE